MVFEYKNWTVELSVNKVVYGPTDKPGENHNLYNTGGNQSLIKGFLDAVDLSAEEQAELIGTALDAIRAAIASNNFTQQYTESLTAEQSRLEALLHQRGS